MVESNTLTGNHHAKLFFIESEIIKLSKNSSTGKYPAEILRPAVEKKYGNKWMVFVFQVPGSSFSYYLDNESVRLTYKGVRYIIIKL